MIKNARLAGHIVASARRLGLAGTDDEVAGVVREMVRLSAPLTHARANRRYEDWVFHVVGDCYDVMLISRLVGDQHRPGQIVRDGMLRLMCLTCAADGKPCQDCGDRGYYDWPASATASSMLLYDFQLD